MTKTTVIRDKNGKLKVIKRANFYGGSHAVGPLGKPGGSANCLPYPREIFFKSPKPSDFDDDGFLRPKIHLLDRREELEKAGFRFRPTTKLH